MPTGVLPARHVAANRPQTAVDVAVACSAICQLLIDFKRLSLHSFCVPFGNFSKSIPSSRSLELSPHFCQLRIIPSCKTAALPRRAGAAAVPRGARIMLLRCTAHHCSHFADAERLWVARNTLGVVFAGRCSGPQCPSTSGLLWHAPGTSWTGRLEYRTKVTMPDVRCPLPLGVPLPMNDTEPLLVARRLQMRLSFGESPLAGVPASVSGV